MRMSRIVICVIRITFVDWCYIYMDDSIRINKKSLRGFLVGMVIAAPIFIGGTFLLNNNGESNPAPNPNPNTNPPAEEQITLEFNINSDTHILGDKKAKVTMIVYSDFQCPYCSKHHATMKQVVEKYGDDVNLVWRNFPLSFHEYAVPAAQAAECAGEQGKFWEYADKLFENQADFANEPWLSLAGELGLNEGEFTSCVDTEKYKDRVAEDMNEGFGNGVEGTPATFVNGELISGALPFETFEQVIDSYLQ